MDYKNEIFIIFSIFDFGNLDITKMLNVTPSKINFKGDIRRGTIKYKHDMWTYEVVDKNIFDVDILLNSIIDTFKDKKDILKDLSQKHDIQIAIVGYLKKGMPCIHFTKEQIGFFHSIGAEIDIDLYSCEEEKSCEGN